MTRTNNIYRKNAGKIIITILLAALAFIVLYPFIWMLVTSFKPEAEIVSYPPKLFSGRFSLDSYINIWKRVPFLKYYRNTIIFSTAVTVTSLVFDTMAGYAFARMNFPGKNIMFLLVMGTMIFLKIPNSVQPSIRPASSSPLGREIKKERIMKIPKALVARGRTSPGYVLIRPNLKISM